MSTPVGGSGAPSAPSRALGVSTVSSRTQTSISLQWTLDVDAGVAGYNVYLDGAQVGTTTATSFTFTGLACGTSHQLEVEAFDSAGNVSARTTRGRLDIALRRGSPASSPPTPSTRAPGASLHDASGNGHDGTISGATWAAGTTAARSPSTAAMPRSTSGALGTFYQTGFTLEAWVQKAGTKKDVGRARQLDRRAARCSGSTTSAATTT